MFTRIQARNFRCLRRIDQTLGRFHALVGPNASGKTTFLDVTAFLSDLMRFRGSVTEATRARSANFSDLLWMRKGRSFQLAVEAEIPDRLRKQITFPRESFTSVRYEIEVSIDAKTKEIGLNHERVILLAESSMVMDKTRLIFPETANSKGSIFKRGENADDETVIIRTPKGFDFYYSEVGRTRLSFFRLGKARSTLANIPADREAFPIILWFREMLEAGVQNLILDSQKIRQPSPPGSGRKYQTDGSNLPWVIAELRKKPERFQMWLEHVRTALEDIESIDTVERKEDKHRYLEVKYTTGAKVPSWLVSDGTLRLLALTIPAYLDDTSGVWLVEEPENGIHPKAIETVIQSLTSIYDGQVLIATHSPIVINNLEQNQILCFAKDIEGATDVVSGEDHPRLRDWKKGQPELGILMASGILG